MAPGTLGTSQCNRGRAGKTHQNYDDQSVDAIPLRTQDFEYTTARKAMPFFPDSEVHVVEVKPLQETFTGIHAFENELFRIENTGETKNIVGNRVISGLAIDDTGRQYQAEGPSPPQSSSTFPSPVPGVAPLCEAYSNPAMSLEDWEDPVLWRNILELGIIRLTPTAMEPFSKPITLLLKGHECNGARVTVFIRLGSESAGGILFRAKNQTNYFAALLDTGKRVASLNQCTGGIHSTLYEAPVYYVNPSIRHKVTVNDQGHRGLVEVLVDHRVVISYLMPSTADNGRFGLKVSKGSALFDGFSIER